MNESAEVSEHLLRVWLFLGGRGEAWSTARQIAVGASVASRTARAHALKLVKLGLVDQVALFPGHRYRASTMAEKRNKAFLVRLRAAEKMVRSTRRAVAGVAAEARRVEALRVEEEQLAAERARMLSELAVPAAEPGMSMVAEQTYYGREDDEGAFQCSDPASGRIRVADCEDLIVLEIHAPATPDDASDGWITAHAGVLLTTEEARDLIARLHALVRGGKVLGV